MALVGQAVRTGRSELAALALLLAMARLLREMPADSIEGLMEALTEAPDGRSA